MVDSVVGPIPDTWRYLSLGEACRDSGGDIQTGPFGSQLHAADYVEVGIPSIMPQNIGDNRVLEDGIARITEDDANRLSRYRVKAGDIVYSRRGDVRRRALIRNEESGWLCGTGCLRVRFGDESVDPRYASFYLGHPMVQDWIERHAHGATMPNLNTSILGEVPFVLPPLREQRIIADNLTALDDKIELNRRMSQTLEEIARALFKSWFVDFDPVHAKAAGREPVGMDAETAALFPSEFEESELGLIPKGWNRTRLGKVMDINPPRKLKKGEVAPYLDMANMPTALHSPGEVVDRPFGSGSRFENGDTLLARITPCLENGKTSFVDFLSENQIGWGSTEYIVMRPHEPIPDELAYLLARSEEFRTYAIQSMNGSSGRQRVPAQAVGDWSLAVPPSGILVRFENVIRPLIKRVREANAESRVLGAIRDELLPKLISGELTIEYQSQAR